ncbi:MAG TPA: DUF1778 domain-containing protein [Gammaproteobacteria bacterium]|nr:DUF1778 domain-containing protein [Gammaproteobacteria bacterium]
MPRLLVKSNNRLALRIRSSDKAKIMKAVALENTDMTNFVLRNVLQAADAIIDKAEHLVLSERDSLRIMELLENPPKPTERLRKAAKSLPDKI